jgi:hypothetical protein
MTQMLSGRIAVGTIRLIAALAKLGIRSHLAPRRSRYFVFRGDQREHEALRTAIAHRLQPYPKRAG